MTTWYDPDEIKAEADGLQRQPEFAPPVEVEEPIVEGSLAVDGAAELLERQAEVVAIVATVPQPEEPVYAG